MIIMLDLWEKVFFETGVVLCLNSFRSLLEKVLNKVYTHNDILSGGYFD